jgi:hypothetical protein
MSQINQMPEVFLTAWPSVLFFAVIAFPILLFVKRNLLVRFAIAFAFAVWVAWMLTGLLPHFSLRLVDLLVIGAGVCLAFLASVWCR